MLEDCNIKVLEKGEALRRNSRRLVGGLVLRDKAEA